MSYIPHIVKIGNIPDILNSKFDVKQTKFQNLPLIKLGFHTYIHNNKDKMADPKLASKFYLVTNKFEHIINDSDQDILTASEKYFKINKNKPKIISRAFFKLWEILCYFGLIKDTKEFLSAHLAEGPGSFIQAVMFYREMFNDNKKDHYCAITLHSSKKNVPKMHKEFMQCYTNQKYPQFMMHTTYTKKQSLEDNHKDTGNLTESKTINNFRNTVIKTKKLADLVTADGGFEWVNENFQEQEAYQLIFGQILAAINVQKKGGSFVLKIFETFTNLTIKYICLLKSLYNEVYICKPLTSRPSNSEKYIVCKDFKLGDTKKVMPKLIKILDNLNKIKSGYISDIFSDYKIPKSLYNSILNLNIKLSCEQYKEINKIIEYKNGGNYFGDKYHTYKKEQLEANKWWIENFFTTKNNLKSLLRL